MTMKDEFRFRPGWPRLALPLACLSLLLAVPGPARSAQGPDLSVTKTCVANGPQSVLCTVTVTNIGTVPSVAPLTVSDTPTAPAGSTYTGAGGSLPIGCSLGAGPVLPIPCTANVSLQPAQSETVLFSFHVPDGAAFTNCVTVTQARNPATLPDPNEQNNTDICTSIGGNGGNDGNGDGGRGRITFAKKVVNATKQPTPGSFEIEYQCMPAAPVHVTLTAPGYQQTVAIPAGAECKFAEVPPPAPKGCRWITTYPDGQYGGNGDRLVVQNELSCPGNGGGDGDGGRGKITFAKKIVNDTPNRVTGPFQIQYQCMPGNVPTNLTLAAPSYQQTVAVAGGAECKFTEMTPPAPKGCEWIVTYPNGQYGKDGDRLVVQNELSCKGGGDDGNGDGGPSSCPAGQSLVTFPGSKTQYCCDGKPGDDKFCCSVVRPRPLPLPRKR